VGSVVVPDLAPGPAIVAAVCVGPDPDRDALEAGIRSSGAFLLAGIGAPAVSLISPEFEAFAQGFLGSTNHRLRSHRRVREPRSEPTLIQNIAQFDALGLQVFTVLPQPQTKDDCKKGGWTNFPGLGFHESGSMHRVREHGPAAHDHDDGAHDHYHHHVPARRRP
jgi:hypothetical protein